MKKPLVLIGLVAGSLSLFLFAGCGGGGSSTTPSTTPPTTQPPVTTPPTTQPPLLAQCGDPTPTAFMGMKLKIHTDSGNRKQLDSKPIVANLDGYCAKVGLATAGSYCETRPEGSPQREACDGLVVGRARDTGRIGPTWTFNDQPCFSAGDTGGAPGCINSPDNQFLVVARGAGNYLACASDTWPLADGGSRCGGIEIP